MLQIGWQEAGQYLLTDSGKHSYKKDDWRNYCISTRAHNAVEIDGMSYALERQCIYGSAIKRVDAANDAWTMVGERSHKKLKVAQRREIQFTPRKRLVVTDTLVNLKGSDRQYIVWWQLNPEHNLVEITERGFIVDIGNGQEMVATFNSNCPDGHLSPFLARGRVTPSKIGWSSPAYMEKVPTTSIGFPVNAASVVLTTSFEIVDRSEH